MNSSVNPIQFILKKSQFYIFKSIDAGRAACLPRPDRLVKEVPEDIAFVSWFIGQAAKRQAARPGDPS